MKAQSTSPEKKQGKHYICKCIIFYNPVTPYSTKIETILEVLNYTDLIIKKYVYMLKKMKFPIKELQRNHGYFIQ